MALIYLYFKSKDELLVSPLRRSRRAPPRLHARGAPQARRSPGALRRVIELQLGLLEGERAGSPFELGSSSRWDEGRSAVKTRPWTK